MKHSQAILSKTLPLVLLATTTACMTTQNKSAQVPAYPPAPAYQQYQQPQPVVVAPVQQPTVQQKMEEQKLNAQEQYLRSVLSMRDEGRISDVQASHMIQLLLNKKAEATPQQQKSTIKVAATQAPMKPKETFANYSPNNALKGRLRSIGSDTMDNIMKYWGIGFKSFHKKIHFFHEGKGSGTATPALMENRADVGPMSRPLKSKEINAFKTKYKYEPTQIPVAVDCLAVFVHPDNPLAKKGLSLTQLDRIFSTTVKRSGGAVVKTWGQLGLSGEWANKPLKIYGRNSSSGTHSLFKKLVLLSGVYNPKIIEKVSSQQIAKEISSDKYAIGYSGIGYNNSNIEVVPLSAEDNQQVYKPERAYAYTGKYPLSRYLYLTLNLPTAGKKPLHKEFINYVFSKEGQAIVSRNGFFPVDQATASKWLTTVAH